MQPTARGAALIQHEQVCAASSRNERQAKKARAKAAAKQASQTEAAKATAAQKQNSRAAVFCASAGMSTA
jgi:hypothetical protein